MLWLNESSNVKYLSFAFISIRSAIFASFIFNNLCVSKK